MIITQPSYRPLASMLITGPTATYVGGTYNNTDSPSMSFVGMNLGPASPDRIIVAHIVTSNVYGNPTVTIGGQGMTRAIVAQQGPGYGEIYIQSAFYYAPFPTGTTATVTINNGSWAMFYNNVDLYSIQNASSSVPYTTAANSGGSITAVSTTLIGLAPGDVAIAGAYTLSPSNTWSPPPLVEQYDRITEGGTSAALGIVETAGNLTCTITGTNTGNKTLAAIAWR